MSQKMDAIKLAKRIESHICAKVCHVFNISEYYRENVGQIWPKYPSRFDYKDLFIRLKYDLLLGAETSYLQYNGYSNEIMHRRVVETIFLLDNYIKDVDVENAK